MSKIRLTLVAGSILFLAVGCLLALYSFMGQGINDGESRNISRTGLPSSPDLIEWSSWQTNDGSVYPFSSFQGENRPAFLPEFRIGRAKGFFFDFVFYQGRCTLDGSTRVYPAIGPGWGASYHWFWSWFAFALGIILLASARRLRGVSLSR